MKFSPESYCGNLGYAIHICDPYFIYIINRTLVSLTNH